MYSTTNVDVNKRLSDAIEPILKKVEVNLTTHITTMVLELNNLSRRIEALEGIIKARANGDTSASDDDTKVLRGTHDADSIAAIAHVMCPDGVIGQREAAITWIDNNWPNASASVYRENETISAYYGRYMAVCRPALESDVFEALVREVHGVIPRYVKREDRGYVRVWIRIH